MDEKKERKQKGHRVRSLRDQSKLDRPDRAHSRPSWFRGSGETNCSAGLIACTYCSIQAPAMSYPNSPGQYQGGPSQQHHFYQGPPPDSGNLPQSSHISQDPSGAYMPIQGPPQYASGSSNWRSSGLRNANMFDKEAAAQYAAEGSHSESHHFAESQPASEEESKKTTTTRVAKACVPCSTKKRRCDGGE